MWDNTEANVAATITLAPGDGPGDAYTWINTLFPAGIGLGDYDLSITDVTTGDTEFASGTVGVGDPLFSSSLTDQGTLTFTSSGPVPEPGTISLVLVGIGSVVAKRRLWP
jgi:hypothetical protein